MGKIPSRGMRKRQMSFKGGQLNDKKFNNYSNYISDYWNRI
jgi:hypothetical protein